MNQSRPRQNFHAESEAAINAQINFELHTSYVYLSMSFFFDRDDIAMHKVSEYFKKRSNEEYSHAEKLMAYQNKRGGRISLKKIEKPDSDEWGTLSDAMGTSLELERKVNQSLLDLHKTAEKHGDVQMANFIEGTFLDAQVEDIRELSNYITNLSHVGTGLGEYMFDKNL